MELLAIDPGPHCGYVWCNLYNNQLEILLAGTYVPQNLEMVWTFFKRYIESADVVIVEDYRTVRQLSKDGLFTIEALGVLIAESQLLCTHRVDEPVVLQLPSAKKPFAKQAASRMPRQGPHAQDALAHVLAYLHLRKLVPVNWTP
jgi:hypothetical protein